MFASIAQHPLDRPVWNALRSRHAPFALGSPAALRYPPEVAAFMALRDESPEAEAALAELLPPGALGAFVEVDPHRPSDTRFECVASRPIDQMLGGPIAADPGPREPLDLGPADVPEMMALVELTQPGPFAPRTLEMGHYLGFREGGRLVAMAGERMCLDGYTEVSAICTHPEHQGRGLARSLIIRLVREISARNERPFLHVKDENLGAIALYRKLGFEFRTRVHYTILRRRG